MFKGGDQNINRSGRPKGKPNKTTEAIRAVLADFIAANIEDIQKEYNTLKPSEKLQFIDKLLKHILPAPLPDYELMTEEQFNTYIQELKELKRGCYSLEPGEPLKPRARGPAAGTK